jgi:hypothetical protein
VKKTIVEFNLFFEAVVSPTLVSPAMGLEALAYATTKKMVGGGNSETGFMSRAGGTLVVSHFCMFI